MRKTPRENQSNLCLVNPFGCRMWGEHYRLAEGITESSCRDEIASFSRHGQRQPVLGRLVKGDAGETVELIYGARRLFVAKHLNVDLLVDIRDIDDREAFVEMDAENRLRRDVSPYERGIAYAAWLRRGHFSSQKDIAESLGISTSQVSRLLRFAELPVAVVGAFRRHGDIKEAWAVALAQYCEDPEVRTKMSAVARSLSNAKDDLEPDKIFGYLLDFQNRAKRSRTASRDIVVRSAEGRVLFRICHRTANVCLVIPRDRADTVMLASLTQSVRALLEHNSKVQSGISLNGIHKTIHAGGHGDGAFVAAVTGQP